MYPFNDNEKTFLIFLLKKQENIKFIINGYFLKKKWKCIIRKNNLDITFIHFYKLKRLFVMEIDSEWNENNIYAKYRVEISKRINGNFFEKTESNVFQLVLLTFLTKFYS